MRIFNILQRNNFLRIINEFRKEVIYYLIDKKTRLIKVKKYSSLNRIKLNLGFGSNPKKGFINIDLNKYADLRLDLRKPLPFKENSVDYIYSEHFFEHLSYIDSTVERCLRNYLKILKKGCKMRLIIPDMEKVFKAYINRDYKFFDLLDKTDFIPKRNRLLIDYVNFGVYQYGEHKYCYDYEKIESLLKLVGFKNIFRDKFDPKEDSKSEIRKKYSLYVESEKP